MSKNKNTKNRNTIRETKKAAVLGEKKNQGFPIVIILVVICIIGGGVFAAIQFKNRTPASSVGAAAAPQPTKASTVTYPVDLFADGNARHYNYKEGNETVRYFILKSADGVVRAAFDACDVCWPAGKGYYQEGDNMVCRNCGRRFASNRINEVKGGCNPAPLNRSVKDNQLVIRVNDILEGKSYFDFSGRG